jgi:hypothetical protein
MYHLWTKFVVLFVHVIFTDIFKGFRYYWTFINVIHCNKSNAILANEDTLYKYEVISINEIDRKLNGSNDGVQHSESLGFWTLHMVRISK